MMIEERRRGVNPRHLNRYCKFFLSATMSTRMTSQLENTKEQEITNVTKKLFLVQTSDGHLPW